MALISSLFLLTLVSLASTASVGTRDVIEDTELVLAFMTHRHGDRTPIPATMSLLSNIDVAEAERLIAPYGYGQLTDKGKQTAYKTGEFIRRRYNEIIAPKYNRSEMYIRSTDSTRTKMTVLTAMSAIFPALEDNWSTKINWDPVPYTTVPVKYDYNQATLNCPNFSTAYRGSTLTVNSRMNPYTDLIRKTSEIIGSDISRAPILISAVYDVYVALDSLGYDIGDDIRELMPELREATGVAWDITTGNPDHLNLQAGPLLNEFFEKANEVIAGQDTQKVRIYSAHDFNVYSLESIAQVTPRQGAPRYASLFSLELRRVKETGKYVVLPVYLADPHEGVEKYLEVEGCGSLLCDYDKFYNITSKNILDESTWRTQCGFSEDMIIDSSNVD